MRYFRRLFYKPKHAADTGDDYGIYRSLAPSVAGIALCTACLCGTSWAWFTATATTGVESIQTASYSADATIASVTDGVQTASLADEDVVAVCDKGDDGIMTYTFPSDGAYSVMLTPSGTATVGYCKIDLGDDVYYTPQLTAGSMTVIVNATAGQTLTIVPQWGTYSGEATIGDGDTIGESSGSGSSEEPASSTADDTDSASEEEGGSVAEGSSSTEESASASGDSPLSVDSSSSESSGSTASADAATDAGTSAVAGSSGSADGQSSNDPTASAVASVAV